MAYLSKKYYNGDGTTKTFSLPASMGYVSKTHIKVYVDSGSGFVENTTFTWDSDSVIRIDPAPPSGTNNVLIQRITPTDARLVEFQDATVLTEKDLNNAVKQNFCIMQERVDQEDFYLAVDIDDKYDAQNKKIKNLTAGVNNDEAVNVGQMLPYQTACEAAQTAAEAAQTAAETAKTAAETAQTNAETAETNAETAETNAVTAKNAAETAQTAAEAAQAKAEDWASHTGSLVPGEADYSAKEYAIGTFVPAGSAKDWAITPEDTLVDATDYSALHHSAKANAQRVLAETAKTAAEAAQTAAETAETNAETAETNAAASASAASTSETNAATSEANALSYKNAAQAAQTAAETAQTAAETAQTAAETAETNAETAEANAQTWAEGLFSLPSTDHTAEGFKVTMTAGTALAFGNLCYIGSDGKMELTDADAEATMPATHICLETISENNTGEFLHMGFIRDDTWTLTPGTLIYASTTAGSFGPTAPSGSGDIVQVIGVAVTADVIFFKPDFAYAEIA